MPEAMQRDEPFLKLAHRLLLEYEVVEGELCCPETGRRFPISKSIPNMLSHETEASHS